MTKIQVLAQQTSNWLVLFDPGLLRLRSRGVVIGVVLASLVGGNVVVSVLLIFVTLFIFYWSQANNGVMMLSITTMLALLYGLLGEFSIGLLLTRLLETAIGAAIGILVALFVLPTPTSETVREGMRAYLARLDDPVNASIGRLTDEPGEAESRLAQSPINSSMRGV
jgi:uncharacterized membrane protein YgaE (UPF0421/DUF939 family)